MTNQKICKPKNIYEKTFDKFFFKEGHKIRKSFYPKSLNQFFVYRMSSHPPIKIIFKVILRPLVWSKFSLFMTLK